MPVFVWDNGWLFKRSILISLFVINFRKIVKHLLNLNTDESVSAVRIKNGSILHFNHLYGFWSLSLLSQLELVKVLVFGKVCFNLIKLSLFVLFNFSFFCYFLFLFYSFVFTGVRTISPQSKLHPRLGLGFGLALEVGLRLGGNFPPKVLHIGSPNSKSFFTLLHC